MPPTFSRCCRIVDIWSGEYVFIATSSTSSKKLYRFDLDSELRGPGLTCAVINRPILSKLTFLFPVTVSSMFRVMERLGSYHTSWPSSMACSSKCSRSCVHRYSQPYWPDRWHISQANWVSKIRVMVRWVQVGFQF